MAQLITKQYLVDHFGIPGEFAADGDSRLDGPLASAEKRMRNMLTDAVYEPMTVDGFGNTDEDESRQLTECEQAEGLMTLYFALRQLNLKILEKGGVLASTGWEDSRQSFLSENQLTEIRTGFYDDAVELLAEYIPEADTSDDETADDILNAGAVSMIAI